MPQNPPVILQLLFLDPIIASVRIAYNTRQALMDHLALALIIHYNIAWVICLIMVGIGKPFTAYWRLETVQAGDDTGEAFLFACLAVSTLWFSILLIIIGCEFAGFLAWACVYLAAVQFGWRRPRLLPLIERFWLALGYDLMATWRVLVGSD